MLRVLISWETSGVERPQALQNLEAVNLMCQQQPDIAMLENSANIDPPLCTKAFSAIKES